MQFGIGISTHITNRDIIRYAEELGYDRAWVGDSQMIWSDCYATMARRWITNEKFYATSPST